MSDAGRGQAGRDGDRMARRGEWQVIDYDGNPLPGAWDTEEQAHEEGICGRYLLSGLEVRQVPDAASEVQR